MVDNGDEDTGGVPEELGEQVRAEEGGTSHDSHQVARGVLHRIGVDGYQSYRWRPLVVLFVIAPIQGTIEQYPVWKVRNYIMTRIATPSVRGG